MNHTDTSSTNATINDRRECMNLAVPLKGFMDSANSLTHYYGYSREERREWIQDMAAALSVLEFPDYCSVCARGRDHLWHRCYPMEKVEGNTWRYVCHKCDHKWLRIIRPDFTFIIHEVPNVGGVNHG